MFISWDISRGAVAVAMEGEAKNIVQKLPIFAHLCKRKIYTDFYRFRLAERDARQSFHWNPTENSYFENTSCIFLGFLYYIGLIKSNSTLKSRKRNDTVTKSLSFYVFHGTDYENWGPEVWEQR